MRRYLATDGEYGAIPDWYLTLRACDRLNCTPWELRQMPDGEYWQSRALMADRAEDGARKTREQAKAGKSGKR